MKILSFQLEKLELKSKVEIELICDNSKCGETVAFAFVGESEFTESA